MQAEALLRKNLENAKASLEVLVADLQFLRDQVTITQVSSPDNVFLVESAGLGLNEVYRTSNIYRVRKYFPIITKKFFTERAAVIQIVGIFQIYRLV